MSAHVWFGVIILGKFGKTLAFLCVGMMVLADVLIVDKCGVHAWGWMNGFGGNDVRGRTCDLGGVSCKGCQIVIG